MSVSVAGKLERTPEAMELAAACFGRNTRLPVRIWTHDRPRP